MDDKTLKESQGQGNYAIYWDTPEGEEIFVYFTGAEELWETNESVMDGVPIAFPRTLKAARQILKEAGWTIVQNRP